ncbi:MAG: hypothetical protein NTV34_21250 [Proteobacteria bacterium]|nr:hypothetical protein [Pseudomonadota bacterium]
MLFMPITERLVIAAAGGFEAEPLLAAMSALNFPFTFVEVGIGSTKASLIACALRGMVYNRTVLFIGSCGASREVTDAFLVCPSSVVWRPSDVRHGDSYLIPGAEPRIPLDRPSFLTQLPAVEVSCAGSITLRPEIIEEVYENLELYSVASAWAPIAKNLVGILGVTNQLGPQAHLQWQLNHRLVANLTASLVSQNLEEFFLPHF